MKKQWKHHTVRLENGFKLLTDMVLNVPTSSSLLLLLLAATVVHPVAYCTRHPKKTSKRLSTID
jgi:hypothetical protein